MTRKDHQGLGKLLRRDGARVRLRGAAQRIGLIDGATHLREAKVLGAAWRNDYNHRRPHSSLGYRTPATFAAQCPCGPADSTITTDERSRAAGYAPLRWKSSAPPAARSGYETQETPIATGT